MQIDVIITNPEKIAFQGQAHSVILPGEEGVFEVLPFHRPLVSRLLRGVIDVDGRKFKINRGIAKVDRNSVVAVIE